MSAKWIAALLAWVLAVSTGSANAAPSVSISLPLGAPRVNESQGMPTGTVTVNLKVEGSTPDEMSLTLGAGYTLDCQGSTLTVPRTKVQSKEQSTAGVSHEFNVHAVGGNTHNLPGWSNWGVGDPRQCRIRFLGRVADGPANVSGSGADFTLSGSGILQAADDDVWIETITKGQSDDCQGAGAPTEIASLPIAGPESVSWTVGRSSMAASTASAQATTVRDRSQRVRMPISGQPPRWWVHDRGQGYVTSLMAPVRFENGTLNVYYNAHARNGMEMQTVPSVSVADVAAPELAGEITGGVVEIDVWEDQRVHSVKLWLSDGSVVDEGPIVERIRARVAVDYGQEQRRHRLIYFQPFQRTTDGELSAFGESFSYQPLCGCTCSDPEIECQPQ